ncbi:MAG TPA: hypothetical protein DCL44_00850 [Elusimicrobia bacterium]|nr:hypothetical protein [Elusimicrobiota bacterium]
MRNCFDSYERQNFCLYFFHLPVLRGKASLAGFFLRSHNGQTGKILSVLPLIRSASSVDAA